MIFHHGIGAFAGVWDAWLPQIADRYRIVTFDMRGFANPRLATTGKFVISGASKKDSVCITTAGQIMPRNCSL